MRMIELTFTDESECFETIDNLPSGSFILLNDSKTILMTEPHYCDFKKEIDMTLIEYRIDKVLS